MAFGTGMPFCLINIHLTMNFTDKNGYLGAIARTKCKLISLQKGYIFVKIVINDVYIFI